MDIDELLNRYFEGETSSEEERELRAFFTSGNVPDRLAVYTPCLPIWRKRAGRSDSRMRH